MPDKNELHDMLLEMQDYIFSKEMREICGELNSTKETMRQKVYKNVSAATQGSYPQAHSGGCDLGESAARGAGNGTVCTGGLPDAEAAAAQLNPPGGLRETGGLFLFSPEGRTYSPP